MHIKLLKLIGNTKYCDYELSQYIRLFITYTYSTYYIILQYSAL